MLELSIFMIIGMDIIAYFGSKTGIPTAFLFVLFALHKTKSIQRLERVLERAGEVRKVKVRERYRNHI